MSSKSFFSVFFFYTFNLRLLKRICLQIRKFDLYRFHYSRDIDIGLSSVNYSRNKILLIQMVQYSEKLMKRETLCPMLLNIYFCKRHIWNDKKRWPTNQTSWTTWRNFTTRYRARSKNRERTFGDPTIGFPAWFPRQKTSEKRAQKFHTDDVSLPRCG